MSNYCLPGKPTGARRRLYETGRLLGATYPCGALSLSKDQEPGEVGQERQPAGTGEGAALKAGAGGVVLTHRAGAPTPRAPLRPSAFSLCPVAAPPVPFSQPHRLPPGSLSSVSLHLPSTRHSSQARLAPLSTALGSLPPAEWSSSSSACPVSLL